MRKNFILAAFYMFNKFQAEKFRFKKSFFLFDKFKSFVLFFIQI